MPEGEFLTPRVGIFWMVSGCGDETLVTDSVPLSEAEPCGDCLTHPRGHYEMWERWRRAGRSWLERAGLPGAICESEYEEHPRGRIVYERGRDLFVIYAHGRAQTPNGHRPHHGGVRTGGQGVRGPL